MKTRILLLLLLSMSGPILADDFSSRADAGEAALSSPSGKKYQAALGPVIGKALRICIPPGSTSPENLGSFVLVANIAPSGKANKIEIRPETTISRCFAKHFGESELPAPPEGSLPEFPIVVPIKIAP
jgi:hypothetical protein